MPPVVRSVLELRGHQGIRQRPRGSFGTCGISRLYVDTELMIDRSDRPSLVRIGDGRFTVAVQCEFGVGPIDQLVATSVCVQAVFMTNEIYRAQLSTLLIWIAQTSEQVSHGGHLSIAIGIGTLQWVGMRKATIRSRKAAPNDRGERATVAAMRSDDKKQARCETRFDVTTFLI